MTTKIHMLADTFGRPLRFRVTPGQASDITSAPDLLEGQKADAILADKAYDSNNLREKITAMKAEAVIPSKRNRKVFIPHDTAIYKHRNPIRSPHYPLYRLRSPRCRHDLASMNVDPSQRYTRRYPQMPWPDFP